MTKNSPKPALRSSRLRDRILTLLRGTGAHPTADWLYARLKREHPRLSLGTVYRNLGILIDLGLVKKVHSGSAFDRFEARVAPHYHLVCTGCAAVRDLEMPVYRDIDDRAGTMTDFRIQGHRIEFFGLCAACQARTPKDGS